MKFKRLLKRGDQGSDVKWLQKQLKEKNFFEKETNGIFDEYTVKSVKIFQHKLNLKTDGIVNIILWSNLNIIKEKSTNIPSISVSNGLEIYDISKKNKSVKKNKIIIEPSNGSYNALYQSYSYDDVTYIIGGYDIMEDDMDGKVYQILNTKKYIKVKLCNWDKLIKVKDNYFNNIGMIINEVEEYEGDYYHKYSNKQLESLVKLLDYLEDKYGCDIKINSNYLSQKMF